MMRGTKQVCLMVKHHAETFGFVALFVLFLRLKVHIFTFASRLTHVTSSGKRAPSRSEVSLHSIQMSLYSCTDCTADTMLLV